MSIITGCGDGCAADMTGNATDGDMLVDYYTKAIVEVEAWEEEPGYYEQVLYIKDAENLKLEVYVDGGTDAEEKTTFTIPYEAWDRCQEAIRKHKMGKWNGRKKNITVEGKITVTRFRNGNDYVRVTSEDMPENGLEGMEEIHNILAEYVKSEYKDNA